MRGTFSFVLLHSLWVILLQDCGVLSEECPFLFFDNSSDSLLFCLLGILLLHFQLSLSLIDSQLLLPEALDFALVLLFAHAASLSVHLLQAFVLGELFHQLALELVFHALLLGCSLSLKLQLEVLRRLQFLAHSDTLFSLSSLLGPRGSLSLLHVELVPKIFLKLVLSSARVFFFLELLENLLAGFFSLLFECGQLILPLLLLSCVTPDHLVLEALHLCLSLLECPLLVM